MLLSGPQIFRGSDNTRSLVRAQSQSINPCPLQLANPLLQWQRTFRAERAVDASVSGIHATALAETPGELTTV